MAKSTEQQIALMVDAAQPYCDEPLQSAMICGHAGSMKNLLISKFLSGSGAVTRTSDLPQPVLIAVGPTTIYAFKFKPRGFKIKIKPGSEVARWDRSSIDVETGPTGMVSKFALVTEQGEVYALEATTMRSGRGAFDHFIKTLQAPPD
jgi:hypothetical protein